MMTRHCACCGKPFEPRPQVPDQAYCSEPDCQRARKRQWQRAKIQSDPDYRINQRAAQLAWSQRNQNYWRTYRDDRPEYAQRIGEKNQPRTVGFWNIGGGTRAPPKPRFYTETVRIGISAVLSNFC